MLDGDLDNRLRVHSFHGISASHLHEYALKSHVGTVGSHTSIFRMGRIISQPLEGVSFRFVSYQVSFDFHDRRTLGPRTAERRPKTGGARPDDLPSGD
jgi:hypothetical protein